MSELTEAVRLLGIGGRRIESDVRYVARVRDEGLPLRSLDAVSEAISPGSATFRYRIVPRATLARAKARRRRLSPAQSVTVTRLAKIWSAAMRVWRSEEAARAFLHRPHPLLERRAPIDLALESELGAELVHDVLGRLEHGTAA